MPTLLRLLLVLAVFAAIAFGIMLAMVTYMRPQSHAVTETITLPARPK